MNDNVRTYTRTIAWFAVAFRLNGRRWLLAQLVRAYIFASISLVLLPPHHAVVFRFLFRHFASLECAIFVFIAALSC